MPLSPHLPPGITPKRAPTAAPRTTPCLSCQSTRIGDAGIPSRIDAILNDYDHLWVKGRGSTSVSTSDAYVASSKST